MRPGMKLMTVALFASLACGATVAVSPYAAASGDDVKSLSADEQSALLAGRGMGMARPAELNGYPGPAHVLELATELKLDSEQLAGTRAIFERMQAAAKADGVALIEAERGLDALYVSRTATRQNVTEQLAKIEGVRVHLRGVHLDAHLEQSALLTPHQRMRYAELRGYASHDHAAH